MISSTSTTSTSGVMLMAACILAASPSRIDFLCRVAFLQLLLAHQSLRYLEQAIHQLRGSPVHLDVASLDLAREAVEGHHSRDRNEDSESRRHQRLGDTA